MNLEELKKKMDEEHYIYDDTLSTVLYVALQLGRPLLIEGAAGVGKTEVAKVMAAALDRELVRLQCYEGLDESKALYEWNYQKQLLSIQVNMNAQDREALTRSLFSDEYLLERPLLKSIRSEKPVVLLIDEIDKADEEFEAFLLELLSEMQVTIPEVGTIRANSVPFVVLTSNRARPLSEALRRRCAYLYIEYPDMEKELAILRAKLPHVDDRLCAQVALAVQKLRSNEVILKKPSIAETLDWAAALDALGIRELTPDALRKTAGFVLKNNEDMAALARQTADKLDAMGIKFKVVNVVDLVKLQSAKENNEALSDEEFAELFTEDKPVLFAYHSYARDVRGLIYDRPNHDNFNVHGYEEQGSTTTPYDMVRVNNIDRYELQAEALRMIDADKYADKINELEAFRQEAFQFAVDNGYDHPDYTDWVYSGVNTNKQGAVSATAATAGDNE